jgi:hypothetical protein
MQYVCDAPASKTWFRIETEAEAARESQAMNHAVEKHFRQAHEHAVKSYVPAGSFIEQDIGLKAHIKHVMPIFLTLRDGDGKALATALLPPEGGNGAVKPIVVGFANGDPFPEHADAIQALGEHFGITLDPDHCYPYRRN